MKRTLSMRRVVTPVTASIVAGLAPAAALAHHAMDGDAPATFREGLLSGLAHPVIGWDHLAMVLLAGAFCGVRRQGLVPLLAFVGASGAGCLMHVAELGLPGGEAAIAASLIVLGAVAGLAARASRGVTAAALAAAGLVHGYAYGESVVGSEPTPLLAYLLGLAIVQLALGSALWRLTQSRREGEPAPGRLVLLRTLAVASAAIGAAALA